MARALSALLIGVTAFARDEPVFRVIADDVLPQLLTSTGQLSVWSAGCANGAELITLAVLFADAGLADRATFLGTDCRIDAIAAARAACYSEKELETLPNDLGQRYFTAAGGGRRVLSDVCRSVEWKVDDLTSGVQEGPWDVILCRNVAIYLSAQASSRLWDELASALRPGGFLVTGKAERPAHSELVRIGPSVYRRKGVD